NFQQIAAESLKGLICQKLSDLRLKFANANFFVTPRRIVIFIENIQVSQEDIIEEIKGPSVNSHESAINGFLKSVDKTIDEIEIKQIKKGKFYFAYIEKKGQQTEDLLSDLLPEVLAKVNWPKSMRWGVDNVKWARPIKSILCLYNEKIVEFRYGLTNSSNFTYGHRFFSVEKILVKNFSEYHSKLYKNKVMLDHNQRKEEIIKQANAISFHQKLSLSNDQSLYDELVGLVEWPYALLGTIDKKYMNLPSKVLEVSIRRHQKYISLFEKNHIAPKFIIISNICSKESGNTVIEGNERVLKARLSDANFFYDNDCNKGLEFFSENLSKIVFHRDLGDMSMKVQRIKHLSKKIYSNLYDSSSDYVTEAAKFCKVDLLSETVMEFPELQGEIGSNLASIEGFNNEVVGAIKDHYSPLGPHDKCPNKPVTISISLADKIDSLIGFYIAGERATGSGDQFGLRRSALGIIRIIIENDLEMDLNNLFFASVDSFINQGIKTNKEDIIDEVQAFIAGRLISFLKNSGIKHDIISASLPFLSSGDLSTVMSRIEAIREYIISFGVKDLLGGYKRASNILSIEEKKDSLSYNEDPSKELFEFEQEVKLNDILEEVSKKTSDHIETGRFKESMVELSLLKNSIDNFFEYVKVNSSDKLIRKNRLQLLAKIRNTFNKVADFSKIEGT
ncbi:MAG: glycine--tRNA ligase subunit beta, partial [Rhodospirillaceae bacterium]|nr:glycine--tRNA ligase subunit beta [Rhodospirillaceae bacterium]